MDICGIIIVYVEKLEILFFYQSIATKKTWVTEGLASPVGIVEVPSTSFSVFLLPLPWPTITLQPCLSIEHRNK